MSKRIAVIGSGISGLVSANLLSKQYAVTMFEAGSVLGGHTNTINVEADGRTHSVDLGFNIFNKKNYPLFTKLLEEHQVAIRPSEVSFSFHSDRLGMEYNSRNINSLFCDRRNFINPRFYRFIKDIIQFNADAKKYLSHAMVTDITIGEFIDSHHYSDLFVESYLIPMIASLWSKHPKDVRHSSAHFIFSFYLNYGLLSVRQRPQWYGIEGGANKYIEPLAKPFKDQIHLNTKIEHIKRLGDGVHIRANGHQQKFDAVVLAIHSDQALHILEDPTRAEQDVLSAIPYTKHEAILHTDDAVLPRKKLARASWNYYDSGSEQTTLTYYMNKLQQIDSATPICLSLNLSDKIAKEKIIKRFHYSHPSFSKQTMKAQQLYHHVSGMNNTYYCGAYWGYGFHEDGVRSALEVCKQLNG